MRACLRELKLEDQTWLQTPDNREGWASWFLDQGYAVYIVDETSVGRSTQEDLAGYPLRIGATAEIAEAGFSAPERTTLYPQAKLHTQWPGVSSFSRAACIEIPTHML